MNYRLLQYQALAEPINFTVAEDVTLDKWEPHVSLPRWSRWFAAVDCAEAGEEAEEETTAAGLPAPCVPWRRGVLPLLELFGPVLVEVPPTVTLDMWVQPISQPLRSRMAAQLLSGVNLVEPPTVPGGTAKPWHYYQQMHAMCG